MPDVNVLLYAHRSDSDVHAYYKKWLEKVLNGSERLALSSLVAAAFLRIVTNPSFPGGPTPRDSALAVIEALLDHGNCSLVHPGESHWTLLSDLVRRSRVSGSTVADAQHAAVAIEHDSTWVTRDSDFSRFSALGLRLALLDG